MIELKKNFLFPNHLPFDFPNGVLMKLSRYFKRERKKNALQESPSALASTQPRAGLHVPEGQRPPSGARRREARAAAWEAS